MSGQEVPVSGPILPADAPSSGSSAGASDAGHAFELSVSELANLLATGEGAGSEAVASDGNAYDGNAALALDAVVLPAVDSALDLLTSSADLFDIPALQLPTGGEDTSGS
jgi:hypothetical protein